MLHTAAERDDFVASFGVKPDRTTIEYFFTLTPYLGSDEAAKVAREG